MPSRRMVVCTSAEVVTNCVAQMEALNTTEPLSDGYNVQAQLANDYLKNSVNKWLAWIKWEP